MKTRAKVEKQVRDWNAKYSMGTPVTREDDDGKLHKTKTRSGAWVLPSGAPVVLVEGIAGGYLLDRIKPDMESKSTPSNCTLVKCKYNMIAPGEESQECVACEGNKVPNWRPKR